MRQCEFGIHSCGWGWYCPRHCKWPRRSFKNWGRR